MSELFLMSIKLKIQNEIWFVGQCSVMSTVIRENLENYLRIPGLAPVVENNL